MCKTPELTPQYWLKDHAGTNYLFLATLEHHDPTTAVLVVERIKSEAIGKTAAEVPPRPLNRKPFARFDLRADGSMHAWYGEPIPLANGTDRGGYLCFPDAVAVMHHARVLQWIYGLWWDLLPNARHHLPPFELKGP